MLSRLLKTKTLYASLAGIFTGVGLIVAHDVPNGVQCIIAALLALCIRDGVAKTNTTTAKRP